MTFENGDSVNPEFLLDLHYSICKIAQSRGWGVNVFETEKLFYWRIRLGTKALFTIHFPPPSERRQLSLVAAEEKVKSVKISLPTKRLSHAWKMRLSARMTRASSTG